MADFCIARAKEERRPPLKKWEAMLAG